MMAQTTMRCQDPDRLARCLAGWRGVAAQAEIDGCPESAAVAARNTAAYEALLGKERRRYRLAPGGMQYALECMTADAGTWPDGFNADKHAGRTFLDLSEDEAETLAEIMLSQEDYWAQCAASAASTPPRQEFARRGIRAMVSAARVALLAAESA